MLLNWLKIIIDTLIFLSPRDSDFNWFRKRDILKDLHSANRTVPFLKDPLNQTLSMKHMFTVLDIAKLFFPNFHDFKTNRTL